MEWPELDSRVRSDDGVSYRKTPFAFSDRA